MRVLVTGATGYIGSFLCRELRERDYDVRALVRPQSIDGEAGRALAVNDVDVVRGDLADADSIASAVTGVDVVLHLALQSNRPSVRDRGDAVDADDLADANEDGTVRLMQASVEAGVRRFVFTSTVGVYLAARGWSRGPLQESAVDPSAATAGSGVPSGYSAPFAADYAAPKLRSENDVQQMADGMEYVILRPSFTYGPSAPFAERWLERALRPRLAEGGTQLIQLVHVRDVVDALILAATADEARDQIFNIAGDEVATIAAIDAMIRAAALRRGAEGGIGIDWLAAARRRRPLLYDIEKARRLLGFSPSLELARGLEEMVSDALDRRPGLSGRRQVGGRLNDRINSYYDGMLSHAALDEYSGGSDYWNYGYWANGATSQEEACEDLMDELLAAVGEPHGKILDVACGKGATTARLLRHYPADDITGINISERQLEICRRNAPGATFLLMDAVQLEFDDETFDSVLCVEAACHFDTREAFLREAHRVLKPGGRLVLADTVLPAGAATQPRANHLRTIDEYESVCRRAGFASVAVRDVTEECWEGFAEHLEDYMDDKLRTGEVARWSHRSALRWLESLAPEFYVLASCEKSPPPRRKSSGRTRKGAVAAARAPA